MDNQRNYKKHEFYEHKHHHHHEQQGTIQKCVSWYQPEPQCIVVHQVIGEEETQKSMDICIKVPHGKPAVEQVVNVYVNKICITDVEILRDAVIVCGHFDIKVLYVACLPSQPVHAVEKKRIRFSVKTCIPGVYCGMDVDASATVEYLDYQYDKHSSYHHNHRGNLRKHKYHDDECHSVCDTSWEDDCCSCKIDVAVVLKVLVRVMEDKEIITYPAYLENPKG